MRKKDLVNLISIALIQGSSVILPLFIYPYALAVQGAHIYADMVLSEAVMMVMYTAVLYSFEINGVSAVIKTKSNTGLSKVYYEVITVRLIIFLFILFLLCLFGFLISSNIFILLLIWMLFPLSYIFQSLYFFQALECNFIPAIIILVCRIICLVYVFLFLSEASNYFFVPLVIGLSYTLNGVLLFIYAIYRFKLSFKKTNGKEIWSTIVQGKEIFLSNISVFIFKDVNVILLNFFGTSSVIIAIYSISEKFVKGVQAAIRPINLFFFTKIVKSLKVMNTPNNESFKKISVFFMKQIFFLVAIFIFFIVVALIYMRYFNFEGGENVKVVLYITGFMFISVFFGVGNFMFGSIGLSMLGEQKYFVKIIFFSGIFNFMAALFLIHMFSLYGASISYVIAEVALFILVIRRYYD
ncbi:hypothetical protein FRA_34c06390 [Francisella sp. W12-1067]|nr:hypothetical protein FRA_34c06390 [Francisella sp. W12-1067]